MTGVQRAAMFWTFLVLFVVIVIVSLLVALQVGLFAKAAPAFQNLAVGTILAGIAAAVFTAYKGAFTSRSSILISLDFQGKPSEAVNLEPEGTFEVWDERRGKAAEVGRIPAQLGQGGWYCRLPGSVGLTDRIRLVFREQSGEEWEVRYFSPSFNKQPVFRRVD